MSDTLVNSYIPTYLTEDQEELYRMGLEDKAFVQTDKAVNVYSQALGKSFELHLYNDNTAYAIRKLGTLRPDDFPLLEEELIVPRYTTRAKLTLDFEETP